VAWRKLDMATTTPGLVTQIVLSRIVIQSKKKASGRDSFANMNVVRTHCNGVKYWMETQVGLRDTPSVSKYMNI
jgi:hypothetical protein